MQVISDIEATHLLCQTWRGRGEKIAFVPTMGCLHEGHLSLVEKAQELADRVVVSIFVNPLQFGANEDYATYPRTLLEDQQKLRILSPDLLFVPEVTAFYPNGQDKVAQIELGKVTTILEGANRPGHFAGVATVVKRLFELVQPDYAIFGEKDFQQLIVIKQLVKRFALNIEVIGMPTFRAEDGLAMSSRNVYLSAAERKTAPILHQTLNWLKELLISGVTDYQELEKEALLKLEKAGFEPDYVVIREVETLAEVQAYEVQKVILAAAKLGKTRLIDNIRV